MLRGFGLQLARRFDIGHERQVHERGAVAAEFVAELADRLEERQAFDVAHRAADLDQQEVDIALVRHHEILDGVGHVGDHLHRAAQIAAPALAVDHPLIDAAGGDVVGFRGRHRREALVMAEVEIGLRAVVGHVDLAVLERAHRARIDVEIGIEFPQPHTIAACLQERAESRRRQTFAQRGDHAAGDEYQPRHGIRPYAELVWRLKRKDT
jgi:hypothetical protein